MPTETICQASLWLRKLQLKQCPWAIYLHAVECSIRQVRRLEAYSRTQMGHHVVISWSISWFRPLITLDNANDVQVLCYWTLGNIFPFGFCKHHVAYRQPLIFTVAETSLFGVFSQRLLKSIRTCQSLDMVTWSSLQLLTIEPVWIFHGY